MSFKNRSALNSNGKQSDDKKWQETFKNILQNKKAEQEVVYTQKNNIGRFFGYGLQSFPREVRVLSVFCQ